MYYKSENEISCNQNESRIIRRAIPDDIYLEPGYSIEVFAEGLNSPSSILFDEDDNLIIADSGYVTKTPFLYILKGGNLEVFASGFRTPITGICFHGGDLYVSHRGTITVIKHNGTRKDLIVGLPSEGDFSNSRVTFGPDGKMYFGQGAATNSGVVGIDNTWAVNNPINCDLPADYVILVGQNFETNNMFAPSVTEKIKTGAFSPFGETNNHHEVRKGIIRASGSILRANSNGSELENVAWGFRSPSYIKFDDNFTLYVSNNGYDIRGSRPIANAPDEFHIVEPGLWYGWPNFAGGEPVTLEKFRPEGGLQPEFLFSGHPNQPPRPYVSFPSGSTIIGFDFNKSDTFGQVGDIFMAEFGSIKHWTFGDLIPQYLGAGHRISKIDKSTRNAITFAVNKTGYPVTGDMGGGFGRPADLAFGPDGALYVADMGVNTYEDLNVFIPNSGVIWRISRT